MKIIFLDIDGVLNSGAQGIYGIKQFHVNELVRIIKATGCKLVLSSGWRHSTLTSTKEGIFGQYLRELDGGDLILNNVIDVTPEGNSRKEEIGKYLSYIESIEDYIILDDEEVENTSHLFKTDYSTGLTSEIADTIIERLRP